VYDYDAADLEELGWDRLVSSVWESVYLGYQSRGIRTIARRWSDLIQAGIGCSQELADELVRAEVVDLEGRVMLTSRDPLVVLAGMDEVLADMGADLAELTGIAPDERARLLTGLARLRQFLRESADGD
jgi:hypothetical protein